MKKNIKILAFLFLMVAMSRAQDAEPEAPPTPAAPEQAQLLTHDQIATAIAQGAQSNGKPQGLELFDPGLKWVNKLQKHAESFGAGADDPPVTSTGFRIVAYTPLAWIAEQASEAVKEHHSFTEDDVTSDMLRPVFRVWAFPTEDPQEAKPGIAEVLIVDLGKEQYLQPDAHENFDSHGQQGLYAEFSLEYLPQLAQKDTEFFIRVTGNNGQQKQFKIKKKHFSRLP